MRTENALKYTIDAILTVAFGYKVNFSLTEYSEENIKVVLGENKITFRICNPDEFSQLLSGKFSLSEIPTFDNLYNVPVLKFNENDQWYTKEQDRLIINIDLLSIPFILLSGLDEYLAEEKDEHDRFSYKNSFVQKYNLIKIPLVDEYAMLFRKMIKKEYSEIEIKPRKFTITPTHDIDDVYRFTSVFKATKSIIGQFVTTWNVKETLLALKMFFRNFSNYREDPYFKGIETLYKDSASRGLKSVFFFMAAKSSDFDSGCDISDQNLHEVFHKIKNDDMKLGLHPGFYTYKSIDTLKKEILTAENALGQKIKRSRQHYLRFDRRQTFDILQNSGIEVDYTMGFSEEEGFKCGTSHEFHPYDFQNDKPYTLKEKPLIVMDVTLSYYKNYSLEEAQRSVNLLCERIRRTEGDFVVLWHNAYVYREIEFYQKVYLSLLNESRK